MQKLNFFLAHQTKIPILKLTGLSTYVNTKRVNKITKCKDLN